MAWFEVLNRGPEFVPAYALDAWFRPSPLLLEALSGNLDLMSSTSPPTHANGLRNVLS